MGFDVLDIVEKLPELSGHEELLKVLFQVIPDVVCFKDGQSRWLVANNALLKLFELQEVDWRYKRDSELAELSPAFRNALMVCQESDEEAWNKGGIWDRREFVKTPGGGIRAFDICKIPLYHSDGSRKALVVYGRDITSIVKMELEMKAYACQLEALNEAMLIGWQDKPLAVRITKIFERLLACNFLGNIAKAVFWAYDERKGRLSLLAQVGLDIGMQERCSTVELAECLCGTAAVQRQLMFTTDTERARCIIHDSGGDYGRYAVPVMVGDDLLGVFCLHLSTGHTEGEEGKHFLKSLSTILGKILMHDRRRREMEARLRRSRIHLANAQRLARVGSFEYRPEEGVAVCSEELKRILSLDFQGDILPISRLLDAFEAGDQDRLRSALDRVAAGKEPVALNLVVERKGVRHVLHCELAVLGDGDDWVVTGVFQDITGFIETETQLELAKEIFESSIEGITITDAKGNIISVNPAFTRITGYSAEEVLGQNPRVLKSDRHDKEFYEAMWRTLLEKGEWSGEIWNRRKSGEAYPEWLTIKAIKNSKGEVTNYVALFHDMSEIHEIKENLEVNVNYDAVTGLPNRKLFTDLLGKVIGHAAIHGEKLAVISVDIDDFRLVNEAIGFNVGDQVLQEMARRLASCVRKDDIVGRLGGDEFVVVIADLTEGAQVLEVTSRILEAVSRPFKYKGREIRLSVSMGIAFYPDDGVDVEVLLKNAEIAMYRSKEEGKNSFHIFTPKMNEKVVRRLILEERLHNALQKEELFLYYQPKLDLRSGKVVGVEALLRWIDETGELVPPAEFIRVAEESGLIVPIGEWVVKTACEQLSAWRAQGHNVSLAVNLSPRQFRSKGLVQHIKMLLELHALPAGALIIEVTEGVVMDDEERAMEVMMELKGLGLQISMDDFGTGYSSMYYLKHLPIDELKIDRSFVSGLPYNKDSVAITKATLSLSKSLELRSVAEGVENGEQLAFLRGLGCDLVQGFHVGRPMPADKVVETFTYSLGDVHGM